MNTLTTCLSSRYIYALIKSTDAELLQSEPPVGMGDAPIELIPAGEITAVASATDEVKIRPQRKYLSTHQHVVNWVAERCSMLPVAFGLIADDLDSVSKVIANNNQTLLEQLDVVDGKVEMLLTLRWAVENVFQYFVSNHDDLKQASHLIARGEATRDEQIELGRLFERRLSSEREKYIAFVLERLGSVVVKSDLQPQRDEFDVMRLACLINRTDVDLFSEKVFDAAKDLSDDYAFAFNGPWAPYSFVSLSLFLND